MTPHDLTIVALLAVVYGVGILICLKIMSQESPK